MGDCVVCRSVIGHSVCALKFFILPVLESLRVRLAKAFNHHHHNIVCLRVVGVDNELPLLAGSKTNRVVFSPIDITLFNENLGRCRFLWWTSRKKEKGDKEDKLFIFFSEALYSATRPASQIFSDETLPEYW